MSSNSRDVAALVRKALVVTLVALLGACAAAPKREAVRVKADVDYDKFTGGCRSLQTYIQESGVRDCAGKFHPGWFGATRCTVSSTGYSFTPKRDKGWLGRTCFSIELPRNANQFKIVSACTRIVDWVPAAAVNGSCSAERQRWLDQILAHEQYHVYQCENEVWQANQRWYRNSHKYSACGFTERGALSDLREKIQDAMADEERDITQAFDRESEAYHQTPAGRPVITNCNVCRTGN
jgi:hypothetical protein